MLKVLSVILMSLFMVGCAKEAEVKEVPVVNQDLVEAKKQAVDAQKSATEAKVSADAAQKSVEDMNAKLDALHEKSMAK